MNIAENSIVELEYELLDEEGELVETSADEGPIEVAMGADEIVPGLEKALLGRAAGEDLEVRLDSGEAFGDYDPGMVLALPRQDLPPDAELVPGDWITAEVELDGDEGSELEEGELEMRVIEIRPDSVFVDGNHPLAGQAVTYRVRILSVRAPD